MLSSIAMLTVALAGAPAPVETHPDERSARPIDFELGAAVAMPTATGPTIGPDLGFVLGRDDVHLRLGMQVLGGPERTRSPLGHQVGEVMQAGTAHLCAAHWFRFARVRVCGGGQLGTTHLRYFGFPEPGRRVLPWGALTGFGDLAIPLGRRAGLEPDRLGLLLQGGAMVPVLGPAIVMRDASREQVFVHRPAPIGGIFGAGLRVSLR